MKYSKEEYENCEFYRIDSDKEKCYSKKVVKVRKEHKCGNCQKPILLGENALFESCILDNEGWKSAYTCLPCLDTWLDHIKVYK